MEKIHKNNAKTNKLSGPLGCGTSPLKRVAARNGRAQPVPTQKERK
jgi:hypothetical protein